MKQRHSILFGWIAVVVIVLAGCAAPAAAPASGGEPAAAAPSGEDGCAAAALLGQDESGLPPVLRIAVGSQLDQPLDPAKARTQADFTVLRALYQTLVTYDPDQPGAIILRLAESWEISDDWMTLTFHLRQNARFADGAPVTAADVVFSLNRVKDLALANTIASVEAIDDFTVALKLTQPDRGILTKLATEAFSVLSRKQVEGKGDEFLQSNSAGSGPYFFSAWAEEGGYKGVVLKLNPCFPFDVGMIKFDEVHILSVPELEKRMLMLQNGEIDIALDLRAQDEAPLKESGISVHEDPGAALSYLAANMKRDGPWQEVKVQQAIRYALDYEAIRNEIGDGAQTPLSFIPRGYPEAEALIEREPKSIPNYDPEKAKGLLAEAGYDGQEIKLAFYPSIYMGTLAQMVEQYLKEVGLNVTLGQVEFPVLYDRLRNADFDLVLWDRGPAFLDAQDNLDFLPGGAFAELIGWLPENDQELAELRNQALQEIDLGKREEILTTAQKLVNERGPYAFIVQPGFVSASRASLGLELSATDQRGVVYLDRLASSYCSSCKQTGGSCCRRCGC